MDPCEIHESPIIIYILYNFMPTGTMLDPLKEVGENKKDC